jgi:hypothetical protein
MKRCGLLLCVLASALMAVGAAQASRSNGDQECTNVHATGVGQDLGNGVTVATISRGGWLNGTSSGAFVITGGAPPVFTVAGTVVYTTKHGTLTLTAAGTFDVSTGAFETSGPVSAGTGKLVGATGTLTIAGIQNLATGAFTEVVTGTICRAGDEEEGG